MTRPPNKALQQTFDPSALFAVAKSTAASNAAELWRYAILPKAQIEHLLQELVITDDTRPIQLLLKLLGESQNRNKASKEKWMETSPNERQSSAIQTPKNSRACYRPGQI